MLRAAIEHFKEELRRKGLEASAELYAEIYAEDTELQELTEAALGGWPE